LKISSKQDVEPKFSSKTRVFDLERQNVSKRDSFGGCRKIETISFESPTQVIKRSNSILAEQTDMKNATQSSSDNWTESSVSDSSPPCSPFAVRVTTLDSVHNLQKLL